MFCGFVSFFLKLHCHISRDHAYIDRSIQLEWKKNKTCKHVFPANFAKNNTDQFVTFFTAVVV